MNNIRAIINLAQNCTLISDEVWYNIGSTFGVLALWMRFTQNGGCFKSG